MKRLIAPIGRVVLWVAVTVVMVTGLGRVVAVVLGNSNSNANAGPRVIERAPTWPDNAARNLAVQFARDYWTLDPKHPDRYDRAVGGYTTDTLETQIIPTWPRNTSLKADVPAIADERVIPGKKLRALITVSAKVTVNNTTPRMMYLTVPVAKDEANGIVVFDFPSLAAGPARGEDEGDANDPLPTGEQVEIDGTLERFFTAYLEGDTPGLEYFTLPGVRLQALPSPLKLRDVGIINLTSPARGNIRDIVVTVTAEQSVDNESNITFPLRYRLRMERGDRWYIAAINQGGS
jgi:hypothetical protein